MQSCLYQGHVQHRRSRPVEHVFRYPVMMAYLDLDEVSSLTQTCRLLSRRRWAAASFCASDHVSHLADGDTTSLQAHIRDLVQQQTGSRPDGPIRVLTQLRYLGYYFSPLNLYYCYQRATPQLSAVVAEVSNTPWREQHYYVLTCPQEPDAGRSYHLKHGKEFHVSPFMDMDLTYSWRLSTPAEDLDVAINVHDRCEQFFTAQLTMSRRPWSEGELLRSLMFYPAMTARIVTAIYWQALQLWWKKCPFYHHPRHRSGTGPTKKQSLENVA